MDPEHPVVGPERTAVVVGGGIAGLAAAVSLLQQGWRVTVLERAPRVEEVGAGLGLTANGLAALDALGLAAAARDAGHRVHVDGTMDHRGNLLLRLPRTTDPASVQVFYGIHRQRLHALLLRAAAGAHLVTGAQVGAVDPGAADGPRARVTCTTADGAQDHEADLVVAADGWRSAVRGALVPSSGVRYSGRTAWRGLVDVDGDDLVGDGFGIRWGPGAEFGALRTGDRQVYWYGYVGAPEGTRHPDERAAALARFAGWADPVLPLIEGTPADRVMRHDVVTVTPALPSYVAGRVVIIGDAAHAMVPTMGQGANTSLEDGACVGLLVARAVDAGTPLGSALADFDAQRRPRTQAIARRSLLTGRFGADLEGRVPLAVRNAVLRAAPGARVAAAGAAVLSWTPPAA